MDITANVYLFKDGNEILDGPIDARIRYNDNESDCRVTIIGSPIHPGTWGVCQIKVHDAVYEKKVTDFNLVKDGIVMATGETERIDN